MAFLPSVVVKLIRPYSKCRYFSRTWLHDCVQAKQQRCQPTTAFRCEHSAAVCALKVAKKILNEHEHRTRSYRYEYRHCFKVSFRDSMVRVRCFYSARRHVCNYLKSRYVVLLSSSCTRRVIVNANASSGFKPI